MRFLAYTILGTAAFLLLVPAASAQITLNDLPVAQGNNRFYSDPLKDSNGNSVVDHPSLTIDGFDSDYSNGLGLKQILEKVYNTSDPTVEPVWDDLVSLASDSGFEHSPSSRGDIIGNTQRMQARAFLALATYVMERNGEGHELDPLPNSIETPDKTADSLRSALTDTDAWRINKNWKKDGVKWTGVLENMARTMDLYLALENAYCYYGDQGHTPSQQECSGATTNRLLSEDEKGNVFAHFGEQIKRLERSPNWKIPDEIGTSRYHTDPGNWPLKVQTAIGYASLTHQPVNPATGVPPSVVQDHVDRALKANFAYSGGNRDSRHYWGYQTDDGKRFWAEGPFYFHYALRDVLPFWHAIRINGMLDYHPDFNAPDPFDDSRFTDPLHWLADLTTPGGQTPPLDDGNKRSMKVSMLLRWTGGYGKAVLGQKFAWIASKQGENYGAVNDLLPVEIAIPRLEGSGTPPASQVGGDQQIIARHSSGGQDHYVLLNGESGAANVRGEGHEQPDQLQLLYYVNDTSFLMDSGYDSGGFTIGKWINPEEDVVSTWNRYYDHNVMVGIHTTDKGLPWPVFDGKDLHIESKASGIKSLWANENGNVTILNGRQNLSHAVVKMDGSKWDADYKRVVIFIKGTSTNDTYMIDLSQMTHNNAPPNPNLRHFALKYHSKGSSVDLNNFDANNDNFIKWSNIGGNGKNMYLYPLNIENDNNVEENDIVKTSDDALETKDGDGVTNIQRVDIRNRKPGDFQDKYFPVATIIQAREQTPSHGPELLWSSFSHDYQGWVWKHDSETYDVFIARDTKYGTGSAVRANLQDANSQYPSFSVKLPDDVLRYGFARVHKSGGEWSIDTNYQVHMQRAPLIISSLSGPTVLDEGEQGTWTASASRDGASYTWFADEGAGWYQIGTGSSVTWGKDLISSTITVDIKVEASKDGETDSAETSVIINNSDGGGGCNAPGSNQICLAVDGNPFLLRDVRAEAQKNGIAHVSWQASGSNIPSAFVVQHRTDSTAAWYTLGTVPPGDSSSVDSSRGRRLSAYRFRTDELGIGTHQFRVGLREGTGPGPRAVGTYGEDNPQRFAGPVTVEVKMDEAYRLSAYPNPVRQQATVELAVKERQEVSVRLYDVLGRRVATLHNGPLPAQELRRLRLDVSATGLTSGTYFLRVRGEDFATTEQMTVVR